MDWLKVLLKDAISSIEKTTELLYQQNKEEGYLLLDYTLENIMKVIKSISLLKQTGEVINIDDSKLLNLLSLALNALEDRDEILLSDILEYEIKEIFIKLL